MNNRSPEQNRDEQPQDMRTPAPAAKSRAEQLIDSSIDGILAFDTKYCYTVWNPTMERISGKTRDEVIGRYAYDVFPMIRDWGDDKHYDAVLAGEAVVMQDKVYPIADGGTACFECYYSPLRDADGNISGGLAVVRDITERKMVEDRLRASEWMLSETQRLAHIGSWSLDVASGHVTCSDELYRICGLDAEQFESTHETWLQLIHPDDRAEALRLVDAARCEHAPFDFLHRFIRPDGSVRILRAQGLVETDDTGQVVRVFGTSQDVTDMKLAEDSLRASEERFRAIVSTAREGIWLLDQEANTIYANDRLAEMLGYSTAEMLGRPLFDFMEDAEKLESAQHFRERTNGKPDQYDFRFRRKNGEDLWAIVSASSMFDVNGKFIGAMKMITDITERKQAEARLKRNAFYDELTDLPNRALFLDRLERAIEYAKRRDDYLFAVLFMDLDNFKVVNDSLGHAAGDQLLSIVARRLETCLRMGDTVARLGGDEFTILLDDLQSVAEATRVVERIQTELSLPFTIGGNKVNSNASIGIALSTPGYSHPEELLRDADVAMYRAKKQGRARYEMFDLEMHTQAMRRQQLESELKLAIDGDQLIVVYQPIVSLETGYVTGFEALVRWQHPERGLISPVDFIGVAEETGEIVRLDRWVLAAACHQMRDWQQRLGPDAMPQGVPLTINVNLSSRHFSGPEIAEHVEQILQDSQLDATLLKLEITESAIMANADTAAQMLARLREMGVRLNMDDFGTGYSSLSYFHRFPLDTLKIDRSFINEMHVAQNSSEIVSTILTMAHNLKIDVVAEGIETSEQLQQLRDLNCEFGQGFFFSEPLDSDGVEEFLSTTRRW